MALSRWLRFPYVASHPKKASARPRLQVEALEDRNLLAVYYFNGGNLFGPSHHQNDPWWYGDGSAWDNPFNWGKDEGGKLYVGKSFPEAGDTAVMRGATEDGHAWTVYYDLGGGNEVSTMTGGRQGVWAKFGASITTLNMDRNWGGTISIESNSLSVLGSSRWQSGWLVGNVNNSGNVLVAPDPNTNVNLSDGVFNNTGNIDVTMGRLVVGAEDGVAGRSGILHNAGSIHVAGGEIARASRQESVLINDGLLSGSSGQVSTLHTVTNSGGTIESTGNFYLPGPQEILGGTLRAAPGSTLNFNTFAPFPLYGSLRFAGNVSIQGGGLVQAAAQSISYSWEAPLILSDAHFNVAAGTQFDINGNYTVSGVGQLASGALTIRKAYLTADFTNDGVITLAGTGAPGNESITLATQALRNNSTITVASSAISLANGFWLNNPTGFIDITQDSWLRVGYGVYGAIQNQGKIRFSSGVNAATIDAAIDNMNGTIEVQTGYVSLPSNRGVTPNNDPTGRKIIFDVFGASPQAVGINVNGIYQVASGATLDLRAGDIFNPGSVFAGKFIGTGGGKVILGGALQMRDADWNFAPGMLQWDAIGSQANSLMLGNWSSSGDLTLPGTSSNFGSASRTQYYGQFTNHGTVTVGDNLFLSMFVDFVGGSGQIINAADGTFNLTGLTRLRGQSGGNVNEVYGPSIAAFINQGHLNITGTTQWFYLPLDNNQGIVDVGANGYLQATHLRGINSGSGRTTLAGTWVAHDGGVVDYFQQGTSAAQPYIYSFNGDATVDGSASSINFLNTLTTNNGSLTLLHGGGIMIPNNPNIGVGPFTNNGQLTIGPNSKLTVGGPFKQTQTGIYTPIASANGVNGQIVVSGTATLGGTLASKVSPGYVPATSDRFVVLTSPNVVGTFNKETLNGLVSVISANAVTLAPASAAVDLAISDVQLIPNNGSEVTPGSGFSVRFTVRNLSNKPITGNWKDAVYLSFDDALDASDLFLGRFADTGGLAAFASRTVTIPLTAPAQPGAWSILVAGDSTASLVDLNRQNNVVSAFTPLRVAYAELPLATDVSAVFPNGNTTYYRLTVPAGSGPIRVTARSSSLDAVGMSARFAELPLGAADDMVGNSKVSGGSRVTIVDIPAGIAGVYYLAVTRRTSTGVTLRAEVPSLAITGFENEAQLATQVKAGDTLPLIIHGTGFTSATVFKLGTVAASSVMILDATSASVAFTVPVSGGTLFVSAQNSGTPIVYSGKGFSINAVNPSTDAFDHLANWDVQLNVPTEVRPRREVHGTITFKNNSPYSQPAPLLQVGSSNALLRLPSQTAALGVAMQILGVGDHGKASYAPGEVGSVEFVLMPEGTVAHEELAVVATVIGEQNLNSVGPLPLQGTVGNVPLPAGYVNGFRPPTIPQAAWDNVVLPRLTVLMGTSYRSYADALRGAATALSGDDGDIHDVGRLVAYLINVADGFGTVTTRFSLSAFGRGNANPFDARIEADAVGNQLVRVGNSVRPFFNNGSGQYQATEGDRGQLTVRSGGGWLLTEADGSVSAFSANGKLDYTENRLEQRTTATYTAGRLTSLTNPVGDVTQLSYNAAGRIASITDARGVATSYGYDASGELLTSIATPAGTTTYIYSPGSTGAKAFTLTSVTRPDGVSTTFVYDALGRLTRTSVAGTPTTEIAYGTVSDPGRVTTTDALGHITTIYLGEFGAVTRTTDALGRSSDVALNTQGYATSVTTPEAGTVLAPVNDSGNIVSVTDPAGNQFRFTYDAAAVNPTSMRDSLGRQTRYTYDEHGLQTSVSNPGGTVSYAYDTAGNLTATILESGRSVRTTYNAVKLPTRKDYADGSYTTHEYDAHRNLTKATDFNAGGSNPRAVMIDYDAADRITKVTYPNGRFVGYHYAAGRLDQITASDGLVIDYGYDALGRLQTVRRSGVLEVTYAYDAAGRLTSKTFANGTKTVYTFDALNRVTRIEHQGTAGVLTFEAYTYNAAGLLATVTTPDGTTTYGYDLIGQLTSVTTAAGTTTYQYDANGNRIGYGANAADQYTTTPSGGSFAYDADGNLSSSTVAQSQTQYGYDIRGRLVYQNGPAGTFQYEYDALGNRSAVIRNGTRTDLLLDPRGGADGLSDVLAEYNGATVSASYLPGLTLEGRFDASGGSFYHANLQGSTNELTDATGSITAAYRYDAFGAVTSMSGTAAAANSYRFNGTLGVADRGTGILDMRNRFYDPTTGRFTQRDPLGLRGNDTNLYRYADNNPVMYTDPSGLILTAAGATVFAFPTLTVSEYISGLGGAILNSPVVEAVEYGGEALIDESIGAGSMLWPGAFGSSPNLPAVYEGLTQSEVAGQYVNALSITGTTTESATIVVGGSIGGGAATISAPTVIGFTAGPIALAVQGGVMVGKPIGVGLAKFQQSLQDQAANQSGIPPIASYDLIQKLKKLSLNNPDMKDILGQWYVNHPNEDPPAEWFYDYFRLLKLHQNGDVLIRRIPIRHAGDPNEIIGPNGFGTQGYLQPAGDFPYTINFQNKPTASAPAQVVTLTQQLDSDLNWDTFQLQSFGFADKQFSIPTGLQSYHTRVDYPQRSAIVDIDANFNPATGQLTWTFTTLDMVTLDQPLDSVTAGFLIPDDANGNGQGFVNYTIQPKVNAITGTRYDAKATIIFDTEAPLDTPAIFNTADVGRPTTMVQPLPGNSPGGTVSVRWPGTDDAGGSGVGNYTVFASINGGAWTTWLSNTSATSAQYTGTPGNTVSFYAIATDNVGLMQFTPSAAQASTTLGSSTVPLGTVDALPGYSKGTFAVTWHTTSVPSGVTVTGYDVYVSVNGGAFAKWKSNTTALTANYTGTNGQSLGFAVAPLCAANPTSTAPTLAQATTTVDTAAPISTVASLPASQVATSFTVNWSGGDGIGSGINRYTVFVSVNGGAYSVWQTNTTQTSAIYTGSTGNRYSFYSVATDNVGNVQPTPNSAQATIQVGTTIGKPTVDRVIVALDQSQRSKFYYLQIVFSDIVRVDRNTFEFYQNNRRFIVSSVIMRNENGHTVATLQFPTANLPNLSLPEGQYRLVTKALGVRNRSGQTMLADRTDTFFRLYGDVNGDGRVDEIDQAVFNGAIGKKVTQPGYLAYLDFDGNGKIDTVDQRAFNSRLRIGR